MTDPPSESQTGYTNLGTAADRPPAAPRWVKVFGVVVVLLVLLLVVVLLTGRHGPSRHMSPGRGGRQTPSASSTGHTPANHAGQQP